MCEKTIIVAKWYDEENKTVYKYDDAIGVIRESHDNETAKRMVRELMSELRTQSNKAVFARKHVESKTYRRIT